MKKNRYIKYLALSILCVLSITIKPFKRLATPMEKDGIILGERIPDRGSMHIVLVANNKNGQMVAHEIRIRMMADDMQNVLNYKADLSIAKKLPIFMKQSGQKIVSDNIFKIAVSDSIKKDFNNIFWTFTPKAAPDYTIILPSPYIQDLKWSNPSNINNQEFQSLWNIAQKSIQYYLNAYKNNTWPLRSYSDALAKWGS